MKDNEKLGATYGKVPPVAIDLEETVLGSIITEFECYLKIEGLLKPESFYKSEHRIIFDAIQQMVKKNQAIDLMTLTNKLKDSGLLDTIGGPLFLTQLVANIGSTYHAEAHARIIAQKYMQREIIRIAQTFEMIAYDSTADIDDILSDFRKRIDDVDAITSIDGKNTAEVLKNTLKDIETDCSRIEMGETPGIDTGLYTLNEAIGGWKAPNFAVFGARPSVGKTTQALQFAIHAAKAGYWVNLYSYEMSAEDLMRTVLAGESQVNRTGIRDGKLGNDEFCLINKCLSEIENLPIIWYDNPNIKAGQIRSNTFKNSRLGKCDFVIIDYIQLIPAEDQKKIREQQISDISRTLKNITTSIRVPVLALSQLNRDVEKRSDPEPMPSDLRESGTLEQDADIILFSYVIKDEVGNISERWNKIAKNRRGKIGKYQIYDDGQMTRIFDTPSIDRVNSKP